MATAKKTPAAKAKAKPASPARGDIVIVRKDADPAPKIPAGVTVWILDGDSLHLTPADMYSRGWVRSKA
jgi:hypothetical protein